MQAPPLIALEIVLGFVAPVGWAVWELWSLRREQRRDREKAEARATISPSAPEPSKDVAAT
ncbi:MAG TPA: hypothetical protein VLD35_01765 [Caldimonas sp.]|nr:hypothetical protein [Caldimonas sp.]